MATHSAVGVSILFFAFLAMFALAVIAVPCLVIFFVLRAKRRQQGFPVLPPDAARSVTEIPPPLSSKPFDR